MQFYVSPTGRDQWSGLLADPTAALDDGPFATPIRARDAARQWRRENPTDHVEIVFRDGTYTLTETLVLGPEDDAAADRPLTLRAHEGETPVLSGGAAVTGWRKLTADEEPAHLHPAARGKLWVADLPKGVDFTRSLYDDDRRLPRARGEGFAREPIEGVEANTHESRTIFGFPEGALGDWPDLTQCEAIVFPSRPWTMNILPLGSINTAQRRAWTAEPCTYPLLTYKRPENTWIENSLAVLREPGMWVCNAEQGKLYLWPEHEHEGESEPSGITVGGVTELLRIEGEVQEAAGADHPVHGIVLEGLTFTRGDRYPWHGRTGRGLQHDWDMHDAPTALVRLRSASYCRVERCTFRDSAGGGLRLDLHARNNHVHGCTFTRLGGTGITLAGYGLGTKDVNSRNEIMGCHIRDIGQDYWHSPGVFIWQSSANRVTHNRIERTPYTGIVCSGRSQRDRSGEGECSALIRWDEVDAMLGPDYPNEPWHQAWYPEWRRREPLMHSRDNVIEYNDISRVMQTMGDGNGIYVSGCGAGNLVQHNHVHDCPSPSMSEGIRCDDDQHDAVIRSNLIHGLGGMATGITIKGLNAITDNIVACPAVQATRRAMISLEVGPLPGNPIERNVVYTTHPEQKFYWQKRLGCHGTGPDPLVRDCQADHNVYWCSDDPQHAQAHLDREREHGVETHSQAIDPGFVDPENGDFRLRPDSPLHEMNIALPNHEAAGPDDRWPLPPDAI